MAFSENELRSMIAISHYAMSPSIVADAGISNEDLAVIGYGFYHDFTVAAPSGPHVGSLALVGVGR